MVTPLCRPGFHLACSRKGEACNGQAFKRWATRRSTRVCALVIAAAGIVAGFTLSVASEADMPLYQRRAAAEVACRDAGKALLQLHQGIAFADDCRQPRVTPLSNRPGYLIVTRVTGAPSGDTTAETTYSALMDGRSFDTWRLVDVRAAPNELSVVQAPPALSVNSRRLITTE